MSSESTSYSEAESLDYTRWLATHHYENFQVVSVLLTKRLHQDFYNVYSFCRWADDLGDEIGDRAESLRLLGWWRPAILVFFAFSAIAIPTGDPFTMTVLALGLTALYFGAVLFAYLNDKRRGRLHRAHFGDLGDDEISPLDYSDGEPVEAGEPITAIEPVAPARPLDRRYDDDAT